MAGHRHERAAQQEADLAADKAKEEAEEKEKEPEAEPIDTFGSYLEPPAAKVKRYNRIIDEMVGGRPPPKKED